jgi:hypothetical protein
MFYKAKCKKGEWQAEHENFLKLRHKSSTHKEKNLSITIWTYLCQKKPLTILKNTFRKQYETRKKYLQVCNNLISRIYG